MFQNWALCEFFFYNFVDVDRLLARLGRLIQDDILIILKYLFIELVAM